MASPSALIRTRYYLDFYYGTNNRHRRRYHNNRCYRYRKYYFPGHSEVSVEELVTRDGRLCEDYLSRLKSKLKRKNPKVRVLNIALCALAFNGDSEHFDCVRMLLDRNADINNTDTVLTPLDWAIAGCSRGEIQSAIHFMNNTDPDPKCKLEFMPIFIHLKGGHKSHVMYNGITFVDGTFRDAVLRNDRYIHGKRHVHSPEWMKLLIDLDADIDARDHSGATVFRALLNYYPRLRAVQRANGYRRIMEFLLDQIAVPNDIFDDEKSVGLIMCPQGCDWKVLDNLVDHGLDMNSTFPSVRTCYNGAGTHVHHYNLLTYSVYNLPQLERLVRCYDVDINSEVPCCQQTVICSLIYMTANEPWKSDATLKLDIWKTVKYLLECGGHFPPNAEEIVGKSQQKTLVGVRAWLKKRKLKYSRILVEVVLDVVQEEVPVDVFAMIWSFCYG